MPKPLRILLVLVLICAPAVWWALRTDPAAPSASTRSSPTAPRPRSETARVPEASAKAFDGTSQSGAPEEMPAEDGLAEDSGHTLSGLVLDGETLQPIAGASVRLVRDRPLWPGEKPGPDPKPVISDAQGAFQVSPLATGRYTSHAVAPGYVPGSGDEVRVPRQDPVRILLERQALLMGQVVDDATGAPVAGAEVRLSQKGFGVSEDTPVLTDAQGRFTFHPGQGHYHLTAKLGDRAGAYPKKIHIERSSQRDGFVIRLESTGSISGRIFARSSRQPLERLSVSAVHTGSGWESSAQPEPDGRYRLEHLPPGEYSVRAEAQGYSKLEREGLQLKRGQELTVDLALRQAASVEGMITDSVGQPVPQASVSAWLLGEAAFSEMTSWMSNSAGHYTLDGLTPGRYRLEAQSGDGVPPVTRELTLAEGERARADFTLTDTLGRVEGVVRRASGGPPLHDIHVSADSEDSHWSLSSSGREGRFDLTLKPGTYVFTAEYEDVADPGPEQKVIVEAGKTARVVLTVPDDVAETSGLVLDSRGAPAPKAEVTLTNDELDTSQRTDEHGRFTLKTPGRSTGAVVTITAELGPERTTVEDLRVGGSNLVLRLRPPASLKGRIAPRAGGPVSGFRLTVSRDNDDTVLFENRSFVGDTFTLSALPAEELGFLVRTTDGRSGRARVRLEPGSAREFELPVGELGRVVGRIVNASGVPDVGSVYLTEANGPERSADSDDEGRFELFAIEPGAHILEYDVSSSDSEETFKQPFTLRPGETLNLGDLRPKPAVTQPVP